MVERARAIKPEDLESLQVPGTVSESAPYGRDADGVVLAPYGIRKDGTPMARRGKKPGSAPPPRARKPAVNAKPRPRSRQDDVIALLEPDERAALVAYVSARREIADAEARVTRLRAQLEEAERDLARIKATQSAAAEKVGVMLAGPSPAPRTASPPLATDDDLEFPPADHDETSELETSPSGDPPTPDATSSAGREESPERPTVHRRKKNDKQASLL